MTIKGTKAPHRRWSRNISMPKGGAGVMVARPSTCREALKLVDDKFHVHLIKTVMETGAIAK
jgi:hypothetical protein